MFKNKLKIAAIVAVVVVGMIVYKNVFDKHEADKESKKSRRRSEDETN